MRERAAAHLKLSSTSRRSGSGRRPAPCQAEGRRRHPCGSIFRAGGVNRIPFAYRDRRAGEDYFRVPAFIKRLRESRGKREERFAGTGKTLLTLAAALTQTLDERRYSEIIFTRATVSVGEEIGFLPGTEEEDGALDGGAGR